MRWFNLLLLLRFHEINCKNKKLYIVSNFTILYRSTLLLAHLQKNYKFSLGKNVILCQMCVYCVHYWESKALNLHKAHVFENQALAEPILCLSFVALQQPVFFRFWSSDMQWWQRHCLQEKLFDPSQAFQSMNVKFAPLLENVYFLHMSLSAAWQPICLLIKCSLGVYLN